jgi:hypothetical protein
MNKTLHIFKISFVCLLLASLSQCKKNEHVEFSAQMLEGDWVPADTTRFHPLANNLFTALSFYNNKGGIPDTSYFVRADSIFVKSSGPVRNGKKIRPDHWRYWRRIQAIRNDTLYMFRHSIDTLMVMVRVKKVAGPELKLQRIVFKVDPALPSGTPVYDKLEICGDTVFAARNENGQVKIYYYTGAGLLSYFQDKIQRIDWSKTDTVHTAAPPQMDNITLLVETNTWIRNYCCYQNFREPEFNQMMRQLDQLAGLLNLKELGHTHPFALGKFKIKKQ